MLRLGWAETKIHISREAFENPLTSATRGGSCAHPDQSRGLAHWHKMRAISSVGASFPILLFFLGGGVALHERLVGFGRLSLISPSSFEHVCQPRRNLDRMRALVRLP